MKEIGNDYQLEKLLIVKQTLLVSTLGNVLRTVWRICLLMLGCKGSSTTAGATKPARFELVRGQ